MITTLTRPVVKRCPYRDEIDTGALVITIPGPAPELHLLGAKVQAACGEEVSHEDFTAQVAGMCPPGSEVVTYWHTGPWAVQVRVMAG